MTSRFAFGPDAPFPVGRCLAVLLLLSAAAAIGGCTSTLARLPGVGEPDYVPPAPAVAPAYPAVHDIPPQRETKPLTEEERKKLADELAAIRDRQGVAGSTRSKGSPPRR